MRNNKICRQCGEDVVFTPRFKHAKSGRWIYASTYGRRVFRFCGCRR